MDSSAMRRVGLVARHRIAARPPDVRVEPPSQANCLNHVKEAGMGDSQVIIGGESPLDSWQSSSSPQRATAQGGASMEQPHRRAARRPEGSATSYNDDQTRV